MSTNNFLGAILLVVGVLLLIMGINATDSFADRVSDAFTGRYTDHTTWYIVGGTAVGLCGLFMVLFGFRGRHQP